MYPTRYGNELGMRAHPGDILRISNILAHYPHATRNPFPFSRGLLGCFRHTSCRRIIVADSASLVPLNPDSRILSRNRSRTRVSCRLSPFSSPSHYFSFCESLSLSPVS